MVRWYNRGTDFRDLGGLPNRFRRAHDSVGALDAGIRVLIWWMCMNVNDDDGGGGRGRGRSRDDGVFNYDTDTDTGYNYNSSWSKRSPYYDRDDSFVISEPLPALLAWRLDTVQTVQIDSSRYSTANHGQLATNFYYMGDASPLIQSPLFPASPMLEFGRRYTVTLRQDWSPVVLFSDDEDKVREQTLEEMEVEQQRTEHSKKMACL